MKVIYLSVEKGKDSLLGRVDILFNAILNTEPLELGRDQFVAGLKKEKVRDLLIET